MKLIDPNHPFFARPAVRWATVIFPALWAGVELYTGNPGWALLFGAVAGYALWVLILNYPKG